MIQFQQAHLGAIMLPSLVSLDCTRFAIDTKLNEMPSLLGTIHLPITHITYTLNITNIMFFLKCPKNPTDNFNTFLTIQLGLPTASSIILYFASNNQSRNFYCNRISRIWKALPVIGLSIHQQPNTRSRYSCGTIIFTTHFDTDNTCSFSSLYLIAMSLSEMLQCSCFYQLQSVTISYA